MPKVLAMEPNLPSIHFIAVSHGFSKKLNRWEEGVSYRGRDDMEEVMEMVGVETCKYKEAAVKVKEVAVTCRNMVEEVTEKVEVEIYSSMEEVVKVREVVVTYRHREKEVKETAEVENCKHMEVEVKGM
ncbi:hypothetical protein RYX36_036567, partial [Vicia faba]